MDKYTEPEYLQKLNPAICKLSNIEYFSSFFFIF